MDSTGTIWMPPGASTIASDIDNLFYFVFYISLALFVIVTAASIYLPIRYRRKGKRELTTSVAHNIPLELTWTIIPTIIVFVIFAWGFTDFLKMQVAPKDAMEIKVTGQKWFWSFEYPDEGVVEVNVLRVPVNKPVQLLMSSQDVIHSFFVPAFRVKMDVLPNRYTSIWFEANQTGEFDLTCTEYCGTDHSTMVGKVIVMEPDMYQNWLEGAAERAFNLSLEDYGQELYTSKACATCHSLDGTTGNGPTWQGLFGSQEKLTDGSTVTVDENYIRESILTPGARITAGYLNVMPSYQGTLKDREIDAIIAYIKTLK